MKRDDKLMETMPRHEWELAWQYHESLMIAISAAILASDVVANEIDEAESEDDEEETDVNEREDRDEL